MSKKWTQQEIDLLLDYAWADDSDTLEEQLEFARYKLYNESGFDFPERSLSSVKKKFYEEINKKQKALKDGTIKS